MRLTITLPTAKKRPTATAVDDQRSQSTDPPYSWFQREPSLTKRPARTHLQGRG